MFQLRYEYNMVRFGRIIAFGAQWQSQTSDKAVGNKC